MHPVLPHTLSTCIVKTPGITRHGCSVVPYNSHWGMQCMSCLYDGRFDWQLLSPGIQAIRWAIQAVYCAHWSIPAVVHYVITDILLGSNTTVVRLSERLDMMILPFLQSDGCKARAITMTTANKYRCCTVVLQSKFNAYMYTCSMPDNAYIPCLVGPVLL